MQLLAPRRNYEHIAETERKAANPDVIAERAQNRKNAPPLARAALKLLLFKLWPTFICDNWHSMRARWLHVCVFESHFLLIRRRLAMPEGWSVGRLACLCATSVAVSAALNLHVARRTFNQKWLATSERFIPRVLFMRNNFLIGPLLWRLYCFSGVSSKPR